VIPQKVVADTDLLVEHLLFDAGPRGKDRVPVLRRLMSSFFCYTTVFNAIELFSLVRTEDEARAVEDVLQAVKILGLNGRSAKSVGMNIMRQRTKAVRELDALIAGVCLESRLPLVTGAPKRYRAFGNVRIVDASRVRRSRTAVELHALFTT
jgi:predicted nucleic acid-binding protein